MNEQVTKYRTELFCMALLLFWIITFSSGASDREKERRWESQIIDSLLDGEPVKLKDEKGLEFLALHTGEDLGNDRAVILVHGIGVHPDWPDVIYPLRVGLPEAGIPTLSIQMPILPNEKTSQDYLPLFSQVGGRFNAAVRFLIKAGHGKISIVAHSLGATMAVDYLANNMVSEVDSLVIVGMGSGIEGSSVDNLKALQKIRLPILELYGSDDLESVLASAKLRETEFQSNRGEKYRIIVTEGANHFYQGFEDDLVNQVVDWLDHIR
ncbi:MAG: DUF3530 family protein [Pseudomonadota bacterium]